MTEKVLELIASHDGKWGWYQLDRHFSTHQSPPGQQLMDTLAELERDRAIENLAPAGQQPRYQLTDTGRALLTAAMSPAFVERHPEMVPIGEALEQFGRGRPITATCNTCGDKLGVVDADGTLIVTCPRKHIFFRARREAALRPMDSDR